MNRLIRKVRSQRRARDMSQRQLAALTGIAFSTVARLERNEGMPSKRTALKLNAWLMGVKPPTDMPTIMERVEALEATVSRLAARAAVPFCRPQAETTDAL